jgi:ribosomal protein S18 acetylase RimI-like enzyme
MLDSMTVRETVSKVMDGGEGTRGMVKAQPAFYHRRMTEQTAPVFRVAGATDVAAIVALVESAYRGDSGRRGWTTESELLDGRRTNDEAVAELMDRGGSCVLLAERDGQLVASCHVECQGESGYFGMFAVDPDRQGDGLGKAVLAEAERMARDDWHCRAMRMTVIEQRGELIDWYERRGYRRTGEFQPFPYGDERFGIPRRDDLRFEVLVKHFAEPTA